MGKTKAERLLDYVSQGKVIKLKSFLKRHHRFDLNVVTTRRQRTFLHVACASGDDAVLRVLLKYGARVDVQDDEGDTPLHLALQRVLHGYRHAFEDLVIPILKSCPPNVLDVANNRGRTSRQLLRDADQLQQESSEHPTRDSAEACEEEMKRKEEAEWQARVQEEWADEAAGMWEENTTWDDQGYTGQSKESYDEWANRITSEHRQQQQQRYERLHPSRTHRTRRDQERDQRKEEKRKFQEKLQEEHERYRQRRSERLHKKLLRQKEEYLQRCAEVFNGQDTGLTSIGYDDLPWPCRHGDPDKMMEVLMCDVDKNNATELRSFMRSQQLLWHPDKFMQKCGSRLVEGDRSKILERVTELSQALNRLSKEDKDR